MSLIETDGKKRGKKTVEGSMYKPADFYKHCFPDEMIVVLKDMLPSISHRDIYKFGLLSSRELAYEFDGSVSGTQFFNIFEFIDRLNLALVKLGITFSLVHVDETTYSLTTHFVKKTKNSILKKDKSSKINSYGDITKVLESIMCIYLERKKFIDGATCY